MVTIIRRYSVNLLIAISLWLTLLRWMLISLFPEYMGILIFAQLLHAAGFGLFHMVAIYLISEYFNDKNKGKGQAVLVFVVSRDLGYSKFYSKLRS